MLVEEPEIFRQFVKLQSGHRFTGSRDAGMQSMARALGVLLACASAALAQKPVVARTGPAELPDLPGLSRHDERMPLPTDEERIAEEAEHCEIEEHKPAHRLWFRAEYLLWWIKDADTPPLVTTGPATVARPGALDSPGTVVLFGGANIDANVRNGGRFLLGWWADEEHSLGLEAGYVFLGSRAIVFSGASAPTSVLARPFFDVVNNRGDSSLVGYPGLVSGTVDIRAVTFFDGVELNGVWTLAQGERGHVRALVGLRYLNLEEDLHVVERANVAAGAPRFAGSTLAVTDIFDTQNYFVGAQVGLKAELRRKRWFLDVAAKVALGDTHQIVRTSGSTRLNNAPFADAGLIVLASNTARVSSNGFAVVPEVGVNFGYQLAEFCRAFVGYSLIYWSEVARPGDQVDLSLNPNLIPTSATFGAGGPQRPTLSLQSTDFWAQGVSFGVEFRY